MSQIQVVSFRASGHFLNWIEAQRLDGESVNQAAQRILKEVSGTSTALSTISTNIVDIVDKTVSSSLNPVMERMAAIEERLGKLSA
ncbi:hypothetical protein IQ270_08415 [Microcoleus sp. LEGE 07076]|nr:hypothetical protein [Microcoleus sp. LEGE 07076]